MPSLQPPMASDAASPFGEDAGLIRQCPVCTGVYQKTSFVEIDDIEDARLLHVECPTCRSSLLAVVAQSPLGVSSVAAITDLSASDAIRLYHKAPLSDDDVLSFHGFLKQHTSSFSQLFTT